MCVLCACGRVEPDLEPTKLPSTWLGRPGPLPNFSLLRLPSVGFGPASRQGPRASQAGFEILWRSSKREMTLGTDNNVNMC